jgi:hypothetical protein
LTRAGVPGALRGEGARVERHGGGEHGDRDAPSASFPASACCAAAASRSAAATASATAVAAASTLTGSTRCSAAALRW